MNESDSDSNEEVQGTLSKAICISSQKATLHDKRLQEYNSSGCSRKRHKIVSKEENVKKKQKIHKKQLDSINKHKLSKSFRNVESNKNQSAFISQNRHCDNRPTSDINIQLENSDNETEKICDNANKLFMDEAIRVSGDEDEESDEEASTQHQEEYEDIRKELADMPFEDLIKLKERLGTKIYNQVVNKGKTSEVKGKKVFKRENKNRPMEMSSKKHVSVARDVMPVKKKVNRDPRFDDLSGEYNEHFFNKAYSFLGDMKVKEKEKLQKAVKKQKNPDKKKDMQYLLMRMKQQEMTTRQKEKQQEIDKQWKKREQERVKEGKTPFYLKKADKRKLELAEKYKELKKSGKIDKYLNKKRRKNAQKEKKKLPYQQLDT